MKGLLLGAIASVALASGPLDLERMYRGETVVQDVKLNDIGGIRASFFVHATPASAFAMLADTEHLAEFMPAMKSCTILERMAHGCVVKMEGDGGEMVIRRIYEPPHRITWTLVHGTGIKQLDGSWEVESAGKGAVLHYTLCVKPFLPIPQNLVTHFQGQRLPAMVHHVRSRIESGGTWAKPDYTKTEKQTGI